MDTSVDRAGVRPVSAKSRHGLTEAKLRELLPGERAYKVSDGGNGLYVVVSPRGSRSFRYDYRLNGRRETLTIGRHEPVARHARRSHLPAARRRSMRPRRMGKALTCGPRLCVVPTSGRFAAFLAGDLWNRGACKRPWKSEKRRALFPRRRLSSRSSAPTSGRTCRSGLESCDCLQRRCCDASVTGSDLCRMA